MTAKPELSSVARARSSVMPTTEGIETCCGEVGSVHCWVGWVPAMYFTTWTSWGRVYGLGRQPRVTSIATDTYGVVGRGKFITGMPRMAFVMNTCQISAGHVPPST